jgi:putative ABC transport system permease protein
MRVRERLREIPGVDDASVVNFLSARRRRHGFVTTFIPSAGPMMSTGYSVGVLMTRAGLLFGRWAFVYFAGANFAASDDAAAAPVAIISASVARKFWPPDGAGSIGQRVRKPGGEPNDVATIVGIVDDVAQTSIAERTRGRSVLSRHAEPESVVRAAAHVRGSDGAPRGRRRSVDARDPARDRSIDGGPPPGSNGRRPFVFRRPASLRDGARDDFSALALLLAAIGTYGVLAHDVASRTHEIGLRVALGARRGDIVRVVARRTLGVVIPGIVIGLAGAAMSTSVLRKSLFQVTPTDGPTLAWVAITLCAWRP